MAKEIEPLCLWCKYFWLHMAEPGYSEYTPGSDFSMTCAKGVWDFDAGGTEAEFRKCITAAVTCKHYKFKAELKAEAEGATS